VLFEYEFKRVDFITEPGEFSVRGGILDVFSFSNDNPYRIEFFGNEVDSIRTFDVESQLSVEKQNKITIIQNYNNLADKKPIKTNQNIKNTSFSIILKNPRLLHLRLPVVTHHIQPLSPMHSYFQNNYNRIFLLYTI
jgi:transcription-repair coupling factor (superfamily II helicase)